jgi:2'-5' RNA ligase
MEYALYCQLGSDVSDYHQQLIHDVANKFGLEEVRKNDFPTHFTLKYWFAMNDEQEQKLDAFLRSFCQGKMSAPVQIGEVDFFPAGVVYLTVILSTQARQYFLDLLNGLREFGWMQWMEFDGEDLDFHCTIAKDCNDSLKDIIAYIKDRGDVFNDVFSNITVIKKPVGGETSQWQFHKRYDFK